jgi:hypothetical protein
MRKNAVPLRCGPRHSYRVPAQSTTLLDIDDVNLEQTYSGYEYSGGLWTSLLCMEHCICFFATLVPVPDIGGPFHCSQVRPLETWQALTMRLWRCQLRLALLLPSLQHLCRLSLTHMLRESSRPTDRESQEACFDCRSRYQNGS